MKTFFIVLSVLPCLLLAQAKTEKGVTLSYGETLLIQQFFANARVSYDNLTKARLDTLTWIAEFGQKIQVTLSDTLRAKSLNLTSFERYFVAKLIQPWLGALQGIRNKVEPQVGEKTAAK